MVIMLSGIAGKSDAQKKAPFTKGVNLTNWFQASSPGELQFTKFTRVDFERIQSLGCDVIRLPINLHAMTSGTPDYIPNPLFLEFLDEAVTWAEELGLHLILDNHTFDPAVSTPEDIGPALVKVWKNIAGHFEDRSDLIYYEVLNEPHGISDAAWADIQQAVIDAIRSVDEKHTIIVGPANWNSFHNLDEMPVYADENLIYTFHFYDPFIFTHQGASWTDPSMVPLSGVPFPYAASDMPDFPGELSGTWIESAFDNYHLEGTLNRVKSLIDIAANFAASRNVPVFCGEFGVYIPNSDNSDRVIWYEGVSAYLETKGIAWTMWDYTGGFGLFEGGTDEIFEHHLNVPLLEALKLTVPGQTPYVKKPNTTSLTLYSDYVGQGVLNASYNATGSLDFYNTESPKVGDRCIFWTGSDQYGNVGLDFKPDINLSMLRDHDFAIKFWIRANSPATVDVRFLDSHLGGTDVPWRMGVTLALPEDPNWQLIEVPLKDLIEKGGWDGSWHVPEGKFDWASIDRFEIVAEHHHLNGIGLWLDEIQIFGEDIPIEEEPVTSFEGPRSRQQLSIAPNPIGDKALVHISVAHTAKVRIVLSSMTGKEFGEIVRLLPSPGIHPIHLDTSGIPSGMYLVKVQIENDLVVKKVIKL
mgnify:CR=1 FL=1